MKLENSLAILMHALRRIRLMLNFILQRKPFMKCQQTLYICADMNLFLLPDFSNVEHPWLRVGIPKI